MEVGGKLPLPPRVEVSANFLRAAMEGSKKHFHEIFFTSMDVTL